MWSFRFAVDYEMIDTRIWTQLYTVTFEDPNLLNENLAWDYLQDTFQYEEMEFLSHIRVRQISSTFVPESI